MQNAIHYELDGIDCYLGELNDKTISIAIIGMGPPHAIDRADKFIRKTGPTDIVLAGFVGALSPYLQRGEIIIDPHQTRVYTSEKLVGTPAEKSAIYAKTRREAVDMEGSYIAETANNYRLKCTAVRAVSDLADEALPMDILTHCYDQGRGRYTPLKLVRYLVRHPGKVQELRNFLQPLKQVREDLTQAVIEFVDQTPEQMLTEHAKE